MAIYGDGKHNENMEYKATKQFRIIESRPATYYWEYIVEAENETEALNKVLEGEIEAESTYVEENDVVESDYEISDVE